MLHHPTLLFAPAIPQRQATTNSPLAPPELAWKQLACSVPSWKVAAGILANAVGFLALIAGCWLTLLLILALVQS